MNRQQRASARRGVKGATTAEDDKMTRHRLAWQATRHMVLEAIT